MTDSPAWWRDAVVYQIHVRSFAVGDGDGVGDLPGITARLDHVADLGADAVWITPFYPSPMADGGYDVADYRDVDPRLGTLADADALLARAHELGLRVIVDIVPNHTSDRHAWFQEALAAPPGSPARARYVFRDGRDGGELPPTDWTSVFGGPAWQRTADGQWYLHLFAPEQPDLDWSHPDVMAEFQAILRFWLDRGVDGFRFDVAHGMAKDLAEPLRDLGPRQVHHSIVVLKADWDSGALRATIDRTLALAGSTGAPPTWVLSNHDVIRHASRPRALGGIVRSSQGDSVVLTGLGSRYSCRPAPGTLRRNEGLAVPRSAGGVGGWCMDTGAHAH